MQDTILSVSQPNAGLCRRIGVFVFLSLSLTFFFSACSRKKGEMAAPIVERDSLPVLNTRGVETHISDSGITRYCIITEEWLVYDRKQPSYWAFEKGVYLERFDSTFHVEATIKADTAYFYDKQKLWKLMGDVDIKNQKGERFNTELLYWDQNKQKVYSDRFIRIEQPDRIITGRGFESNQEMTVYVIHKPEGIFYVEDEAMASPADTLTSDTIQSIQP